jgi:hypothetical protein
MKASNSIQCVCILSEVIPLQCHAGMLRGRGVVLID